MSEGTGEMGEERAQRTEPVKPSTPTMRDGTGEPRITQTEYARPSTPISGDEDVVWVRFAPSQVMRTIAIALLTAAVVLGAFFLLWQVRSFIGSFVAALFLAAVLNPPVKWLERRHRMVKRSLAIVLTYLGVLVGLVLIVGVFVPVVVNEIRDLINFIVGVVQAPEGPTGYLRGIADQHGLGSVFDRISGQLSDLPSKLGDLAKSFLLSAGGIAIGAAGFVVSLVTIL